MNRHPLLVQHRISSIDPSIHQVTIACNDDGIPPSYIDDAGIARCEVIDEECIALYGTPG